MKAQSEIRCEKIEKQIVGLKETGWEKAMQGANIMIYLCQRGEKTRG